MKKLSSMLLSVLLVLNLSACSGEEARLYAGYCTYYPDGGLMSYCEYSYEYDEDGNLIGEYEYYNNHNNTRSSIIREYDASGSFTESEYDIRDELAAFREFDENGTLRKETVYEYGELESINEYNEDGSIIRKESWNWSHYIVEYEYDGSGILIKSTETDYDEDGDYKHTYEDIYDPEGEVILRTITSEDGNSFVAVRVEKITEADNKLTVYQYGPDDELRYITEKEYDASGNLLSKVSYSIKDGEKEYLSSEEYEYDDEGRVIVQVSKITDVSYYRYEYEYSDEGYLCKESTITQKWISPQVYSDGSDAVLMDCATIKYYNAAGEQIRQETTVDGKLTSYTEYFYENVKVNRGRASVFDFRDEKRELDERALRVY